MFKKKKKSQFVSIYVVDDTFFVRKSIYEYLYKKPQNMEIEVDFDFVGEASLKREFNDQLASIQADLFFLDMDLPDGTAWDLIEKIYEKLPQAQIIAMTDENSIETQQLRKVYEDQVVAVLEKPFQPNHLYDVFEAAIRERFQLKKEEAHLNNPKTQRPRIYFEANESSQAKELELTPTTAEFNLSTPETSANQVSEPSSEEDLFVFDLTNEPLNEEELTNLNDLEDVFEFSPETSITEESAETSLKVSVESKAITDQNSFILEESSEEELRSSKTSLSKSQSESFEWDRPVATDQFSLEPDFLIEVQDADVTLKPKGISSILLMEEVYEDNEFETSSTQTTLKECFEELTKSSSEEKLHQSDDEVEKNEENKDFNLSFDSKEHYFSENEEKNLLNEEKSFIFGDFEDEKTTLENNEDFFLLLEDENVKKEGVEDENSEVFLEFNLEKSTEPLESDFFTFEFEEGMTDQPTTEPFSFSTNKTDPTFEFSLSEETTTSQFEEKTQTFEWDLASTDSYLKSEKDSNNSELPSYPESQFEYFETPPVYTETSQLQTEEFFYFEEMNLKTPTSQSKESNSNHSEVEPVVQQTQELPTSSKEGQLKTNSTEFVISPPRSKGPGVPTTPKEFGRFGIRK